MSNLQAVVWYDDEPDRDLIPTLRGGRWRITIDTPDGAWERIASTPAALIGAANRWAKFRGIRVDVRFLTPLGT